MADTDEALDLEEVLEQEEPQVEKEEPNVEEEAKATVELTDEQKLRRIRTPSPIPTPIRGLTIPASEKRFRTGFPICLKRCASRY